MTTNGCRSNSVATSARSSKSRTTLVENDPKFVASSELTSDDTYGPFIDHPPRNLWVDRLLAMFCIKSSSSPLPITATEHIKPEKLEGAETGNSLSLWPSPWILPVHVVSNRQDIDKHPITKIAKCTIDTGNMQGNIVSREFLENVLGFPLSSFQKMTKEEERGGTSITGDLHIPQGAIYLTWYHKNSTRVFRDMRFLISLTQHCDLIIGARSIQKDGILNVPCLMTGGDLLHGVKIDNHEKVRGDLEGIEYRSNNRWSTLKAKKIPQEEKKFIKPATAAELLTKYEAQTDIARWTIEIYEIFRKPGFSDKSSVEKPNAPNDENESASDIWKCIEKKYSYVGDEFHKDIHVYLQQLWDKFELGTVELNLNHDGAGL